MIEIGSDSDLHASRVLSEIEYRAKMTHSLEIHAEAPKDPDGTFDRAGSDEEGHEYLIDLYFDDEEQANGMADRFPSLNDFDAGNFLHRHLLLLA